jgi:hypothetical protein
MDDMLGFICGVYMGRLDRGGQGAGEGVGKTNHISFQNFHYEAAVDPSEHTGKACPCDREKEWRGNEKKKTDHGYVTLRNRKKRKVQMQHHHFFTSIASILRLGSMGVHRGRLNHG